jgi:MFS family permease
MAASGSLSAYAENTWLSTWLNDLLGDKNPPIPWAILLAGSLGTLVSTIGAPVVAGMASAYAGAEALGRNGSGAVTERLAGRWPVLLGVAASFGVLVSIGLAVFLLPGVIAYLVLALAAPVAVMERSGVQASLRRSAQLTHGHRGRILGAVALAMIVGVFIDTLALWLASAIFGSVDAVTALVIAQGVSVLMAGLTGSFTGAVVAVLYIDVRIRSEGLADSLRMAAAADRLRVDPTVRRGIAGVNPGGLNPPERPGP